MKDKKHEQFLLFLWLFPVINYKSKFQKYTVIENKYQPKKPQMKKQGSSMSL